MTAAALELGATRRGSPANVRLKPVEYVQLYGPPERRCSGCHHKKPYEHLAGGRLDRLVLQDLAACAAWGRDGRAWGDEARPSVPEIARRIGYSDRSVQYALRRLERGSYVERVERPGFTTWYRICRPVEPVDEFADVVRLPVHKRRASRRRNTGPLHHRGATVAPELENRTRDIPPVAPDRGRQEGVGAGAPAHAAPRWRGGSTPALPGTGPPPPVGLGSKAHRGDAGPGRARGVAVTPPGGLADGVLRGVDALAPPGEGEPPSSWPPGRASRAAVRKHRRCPRCAAPPGEACRRADGAPRTSNHAERRAPRLGHPSW